ncbi:hypothetical protein B9Q04_13290 [Candidatus Marsarchaeota G2 archaeon BE_D]|uniref:Uncharacterized protein n=1 Tax=Candidatus Marsarchaeota G2 archaeon BE_D TaxID=1978158 RepID=A0A2R6C7Y9_9ARCH|nr:MAG: hypothetical protein B9Q04_13290 [Candidatus Marsarchaeota G2 archaeon BE_D]
MNPFKPIYIETADNGVTLGPYAVVVALFISLIRMGLGVGTIFSLPGSLPGALLVGVFYRYVWRSKWVGLLESWGRVLWARGLVV